MQGSDCKNGVRIVHLTQTVTGQAAVIEVCHCEICDLPEPVNDVLIVDPELKKPIDRFVKGGVGHSNGSAEATSESPQPRS